MLIINYICKYSDDECYDIRVVHIINVRTIQHYM